MNYVQSDYVLHIKKKRTLHTQNTK